MTLIVAICLEDEDTGEEGVLMFSDSQATEGPVSYSARKIDDIWYGNKPLAMAAGAGDGAMVRKAIDLSRAILITKAEKEWDEMTPSFQEFYVAIQQIENTLVRMISEYENLGVTINFQLLLGSVSKEGEASLYLFDDRGIFRPVHDNPNFACIGSGFFLGGNLLLQQFYSRDIDLDGATRLAAYIINEVSKVDPGVGPFEGESCYFRLVEEEPKMGGIKPGSLREVKSEYKWTKKLLKYVWNQSNEIGPKKLHSILRETIEKPKRRRKKKAN